jgi:hypothetical protein
MRTRSQWLFLVVIFLFAATAGAQQFTATLRGINEVPPADPDGTGTAVITLVGTTVNYTITVNNILVPPTAQHIHQAPAGSNGPIVVPLPGVWVCAAGPAPPCTLTGSTTTTAALADMIRGNALGFYVNVHTTDFPGGAIRGQLAPSDIIPTTSTLGLMALVLVLAAAGILIVRRAS